MPTLIHATFFLSGVAALLFETLWFHRAGLVLGNTVWASSLVLAGFMGGLGLGNLLAARFGGRVSRPLRLYGALELAIGAVGSSLVLWLPAFTPVLAPLLRPLQDAPWLLNPLRFGIAFLLFLLPSTAMGATLPLLVATLFRRDPRFGRVLGGLYGWNTLGAVLGALSGEALLIGALGIPGTAWVAASANLAAAALAFGLSRSHERAPPAAPRRMPLPRSLRVGSLLACAFLCGGIMLACEVVWFRFLAASAVATSLAFAVMLALVLAGIGLGGLAGSRLPRPAGLPLLCLAGGLVTLLGYALFDAMPRSFGARSAITALEVAELGLLLIVPPALVSGMVFTILGEALEREAPGETRTAGLLTLANTSGAVLGSLLAGFLLLPQLGVGRSIHLLAALYGLAALCVAAGEGRPARVAAPGAAFALLLVWLSPARLEQQFQALLAGAADRRGPAFEVVALREGLTESIVYLEERRFGEATNHILVTNGYNMSGTAEIARRYMKLFAWLPLALHPEPRRALLISYGVGSTAKALVDTPWLESIDVVDISEDVLELSDIVFPDPDEHPLHDPRVRVHVEDGRYFLETTDRHFDLITGEPPPPRMAGVVNLYTREYFERMRDRLAEGGFASYWLPVHTFSEPETKSVIAAFCAAFADCSLWAGSRLDWILLGSRDASGRVSAGQLSRQWRDPTIAVELRRLGLEEPAQLGALFMADADQLAEVIGDSPPLDDDHPKRLGNAPRTSLKRQKQTYLPWMDTDLARWRFEQSRLVAQLWPPELFAESLSRFPEQALVNRYSLDLHDARALDFAVLHALLHEERHPTLALWYQGVHVSDWQAARAALAKGSDDPQLWPALAAGALVQGDYPEAGRLFERLYERTQQRHWLYRQIYALCLQGRLGEAGELLELRGVTRGRRDADRVFARFVGSAFPGVQSAR